MCGYGKRVADSHWFSRSRIAEMARAAAAVNEVESSGMKRKKQADHAARRGGSMNLPFLVAKNLLFWGTILLSLYGLYAVVAAI
jgi:hypothetical protein